LNELNIALLLLPLERRRLGIDTRSSEQQKLYLFV
jgi:hypothetical protein